MPLKRDSGSELPPENSVTKRVARFHYITSDTSDFSHAELADRACAGGAKWIQLRIKDKEYLEWLRIAHEVKEVTTKHGATLIVNDNVCVAKEVGADGVHLGKLDLLPHQAREVLGPEALIGGTANTVEDIERLIVAQVDYIGLGPLRHTQTKKNLSPILGLNGMQHIVAAIRERKPNLPVIAIGGVCHADVAELLRVGAHGIAVSSAVTGADEMSESVREFLFLLEE